MHGNVNPRPPNSAIQRSGALLKACVSWNMRSGAWKRSLLSFPCWIFHCKSASTLQL